MRTSHLKSKCGKILCLTLVLVLMVGILPMGAVSAEVEDGVEATETAGTPEPEVTPAPATEPESSPEPTESLDPTEPDESTYENSISGMLWYDENDDGTYDSSEEPIAEYPVSLYKADDTGNAVQTAMTDANGKYSFSNIEPSSYVVGVKSNELGTDYYLLPVVGVTGDNKLGTWSDEWDEKYSKPITVAADTIVADINTGMRTPPGIEPMIANSYITKTVHGKLVDGLGNPLAYTQFYLIFNQHEASGITSISLFSPILITTDANGYFYYNSGSLIYTSNSGIGSTYAVHMFIAFPDTLGITSVIGSNIAASAYSNLTAAPTVYNGALQQNPIILGITYPSGYTIFKFGFHNTSPGVTSSVTYGTASNPCVYQINQAYQVIENYYIAGATTALQTATSTGVLIGQTYTKTPPATITSGGATYTYKGYRIGSTGTTYTSGDPLITNVTADQTVYYYYVRNIAVTFNGNGGSPTPFATTYEQTATLGTPATVTRIGYTFAGWYTAASGGTQVTSSSVVGDIFTTGNTGTLYAHWVKSDTSAATNVTNNGATLNGTYFTQGISGNVYYQYGTSTSYGSTVTYNSATSVTADTSAATSLTGLTAGTTYHYRLVAIVGGYTVYGSDMSFSTVGTPTKGTITASGITSTSANLSMTYNANRGSNTTAIISTHTVYYRVKGTSTWSSVTNLMGTTMNGQVSGTGTGSLTGLSSGTTYEVYISLSNGYLTNTTQTITEFTTPDKPTVSVTHTVTSSTAATLNGTYALNGGTFTSGLFEISSDGGATWITPTGGALDGSTTTPSVNLTGLTHSVTYHYRLTVTNSEGTTISTVGSFTTPVPNYIVTEKFVNESTGATFQSDNTVTVPIATPDYSSSVTAGPIPVSPDTYIYVGYKFDSYSPGDTLDGTGTVPSLTGLTGNRTVYLVYHRLDTTTITVTYPTSPMEFYVDGNTWPNIETGVYGTTGTYYTITNGSECALQVNFKKMAVTNNDGLNFVTNASGSLPGSHDISIDLNAAPATTLGSLTNGFTAGVSNIDDAITYSGQTLGTLDGTYIHPAGALSEHGYITIGGYFADYLTGAGKYPILKFTFEFTLQTS